MLSFKQFLNEVKAKKKVLPDVKKKSPKKYSWKAEKPLKKKHGIGSLSVY